MKKFITKTMVALSILSGGLFASDTLWTEDFQAAKKQAAASGKDLLLDFTGSDWCSWCIKLDKEVFEKDYFKKEASKDFVMVKIDFPQDKSGMSEEVQKQNEQLSKQYQIKYFPNIILATASGEPYESTGYREGGPEEYVKHLREAKSNAGKAKNKLEEARKLTDPAEKAKMLDEVLSGIAAETVEKYFTEVADEIIALDPDNTLKLRNKYVMPRELNALYEFVQDPETFAKKADEVVSRLGLEGDDLKMINDLKVEVNIQAEVAKLSEVQEDAQKLLDGFDAIIKKLKLEGTYKQQLMTQKVLVHLQMNDDIESALKALEEAIAVQPDSEDSKQLLDFKARLLEEQKTRAENAIQEIGGAAVPEVQVIN